MKAAFKDSSKKILKTGSLVAVLEQSLHANDIETINWVISTTDMHIINETVRKDTKVLGLEYDQIQTKYQKSSNSILNGIDINKIEDKLKAAFKDSSKKILKTGSLVAVLEQSLHANDIETINWAISTTDMHIINETVRKDTKVLGLEYDQIQTKYQKSSNSILNGIDINKIEDKLKAAFKDSSKKILKTGSLVAVLEQSLHANDIETINWAISTTDMHIINETVRKVSKETLHQLIQNILIKLQQGVQKSSLLWLSTVLKLRWIDVLKFVNKKSTIHSQQSLSTLYTYLSRKTKNLTKYYEVRAKLQMVIDSGKAIIGDRMDVDSDEEGVEEPSENELKYLPLVYQKDQSSDEEDIDEVVEDFDQVTNSLKHK